MPNNGTDAESIAIGHVLPASDPDSFESRFLGRPVSTSPREVELADPVHYVGNGGPPFLILHGMADTLIPWQQSEYLFDALSDAGNNATLVLFENLKHGFFNHPGLAHERYGKVTVHGTPSHTATKDWEPDPEEDIPSMVRDFFRANLTG
jgi:acetyl esterase/lipase